MSIHALTGKPGAGKSYHGVQRVYDALEQGRAVVTNLPLNEDYPEFKQALEEGHLIIKAKPNDYDAPPSGRVIIVRLCLDY